MRWSIVLSLALVACADAPPPATTQARQQPIVNGDRERGHPAVGALVRDNNSAFCTGTLIRRDQVLTAAHCFGDAAQPDPAAVFFYVGDRAGQDGARYPAAAITRHPRWSPGVLIGIHDVAIVTLAEPVPDVEPYALFAGAMEPLLDAPLFYVGFGANEADPARGGGVKRSTALPLIGLTPSMFVTAHADTGVCFGDSGGPALLERDGQWYVVGINSSVRGQPACLFQSLQVRVDAFRQWVRATIGDAVDCRPDPVAACGCEAACVDGACDPLGCPPDTGCRRIVNCLSGCRGDSVCQVNCYGDGSPEGRALYDRTVACGNAECAEAEDVDACMRERCPTLEACWADIALGPDDCEAMIRCNSACGMDNDCRFECYAAGSAEGRAGYDALVLCIQTECGPLANDPVAYQRCVVTDCTAAWHACAPPDDCALIGGDCGPGEACRPEVWTGHYCRPSADVPLGEGCVRDGSVQCVDGAICDARAEGTVCRAICLGVEDCAPGQRCTRLVNASEDLGVCTGCVDTDLDGSCDADDCAPDDPERGTEASERCADGVDQDCDGVVDEGCVDAAVEDDLGVDAGPPDAAPIDLGPAQDAAIDALAADATLDAERAVDQAIPAVGAEPGEVIERVVSQDDCRAQPGRAPGSIWAAAIVLIACVRRRFG